MRTKFIVTTLVIGILAFLMGPMAPLGSQLWPAMPEGMEPNAAQTGLFIVYSIITALAVGFGVSYWAYGMRFTRTVFPRLTGGAHLAIGYIPASFWLHDALHMANGENINGLIAIEYTFHVPMIAVGTTLAVAAILSHPRRDPAYLS